MKGLVTCLFLALGFLGKAQVINVGVLHSYNIKRVAFGYHKGTYTVDGDSTRICSIGYGKFIEIAFLEGKLQLKFNNVVKGRFDKIKINGNGIIRVTSKSPAVRERKYQNGFIASVVNGRMILVNKVIMENYLSGVLESEAGGGRHEEYYKVQALMSRTYALRNKERHKEHGFSVCDGVHCQAYHNMLRFTPLIRQAVKATKGEVLIDASNTLVATYFSANCGGQVCDAYHVWNKSVPHVETFKDTFCIHSRQATWTTKVSKTSWKNFLVRRYGYPIKNSAMSARIYTFQSEDRSAFYIHPSLGIPMRDLRSKFKLKSSYFNTRPSGSYVIIDGRGFGHGVGLCQEGAMAMGQKGYTYRQIALYYFTGLTIRMFNDL